MPRAGRPNWPLTMSPVWLDVIISTVRGPNNRLPVELAAVHEHLRELQ